MASKNKYLVFAVIGIAAASGAAWWLQKPAQPPQRAEAGASGTGTPVGGGAAAGAGRPVAVEAVTVRKMALRDDAEAVGASSRARASCSAPRWGGASPS